MHRIQAQVEESDERPWEARGAHPRGAGHQPEPAADVGGHGQHPGRQATLMQRSPSFHLCCARQASNDCFFLHGAAEYLSSVGADVKVWWERVATRGHLAPFYLRLLYKCYNLFCADTTACYTWAHARLSLLHIAASALTSSGQALAEIPVSTSRAALGSACMPAPGRGAAGRAPARPCAWPLS